MYLWKRPLAAVLSDSRARKVLILQGLSKSTPAEMCLVTVKLGSAGKEA